jgi:hypothetical protein
VKVVRGVRVVGRRRDSILPLFLFYLVNFTFTDVMDLSLNIAHSLFYYFCQRIN